MTLSSRVPAPLGAVNALIERTLTVGDIVTVPVWSVNPTDSAESVLEHMKNRNFDVAAVGPSPLKRFVRREWLGGRTGEVEEFAQDIPVPSCVDRSLPLAELFKHLEQVDHRFVLNGDHVRWIVTHADLNAPAVGVVALAYLTVIEGGFRELTRRMRREEILSFFAGEQLDGIVSLEKKKRQRNIETSVHDCLSLGNWMHVVRNSPSLLVELGFNDRQAHHSATLGFQGLRNTVAHGGRLLDELSPLDALVNLRNARTYADKVWEAVDRSRPIWQDYLDSVVVLRKNQKERTIAGPDASEDWTESGPLHVITAWNPGSIGADDDTNSKANKLLGRQLKREGATSVRAGLGRSRDGSIAEDSFIVSGLTAQRAAAVGGLFGQVAIFEIDRDFLRVLRCPDAAEMGRRERRV